MQLETFKLIKNTELTHDVFEMVFELSNNITMIPEQLITIIILRL